MPGRPLPLAFAIRDRPRRAEGNRHHGVDQGDGHRGQSPAAGNRGGAVHELPSLSAADRDPGSLPIPGGTRWHAAAQAHRRCARPLVGRRSCGLPRYTRPPGGETPDRSELLSCGRRCAASGPPLPGAGKSSSLAWPSAVIQTRSRASLSGSECSRSPRSALRQGPRASRARRPRAVETSAVRRAVCRREPGRRPTRTRPRGCRRATAVFPDGPGSQFGRDGRRAAENLANPDLTHQP